MLRGLGILERPELGAQERPGHWDVEARILLEMEKVVRGDGAELLSDFLVSRVLR